MRHDDRLAACHPRSPIESSEKVQVRETRAREEVLDHIRVTSHCDAKFMLASPAAIERALDRAYSTPGAPMKPRDTARVRLRAFAPRMTPSSTS